LILLVILLKHMYNLFLIIFYSKHSCKFQYQYKDVIGSIYFYLRIDYNKIMIRFQEYLYDFTRLYKCPYQDFGVLNIALREALYMCI